MIFFCINTFRKPICTAWFYLHLYTIYNLLNSYLYSVACNIMSSSFVESSTGVLVFIYAPLILCGVIDTFIYRLIIRVFLQSFCCAKCGLDKLQIYFRVFPQQSFDLKNHLLTNFSDVHGNCLVVAEVMTGE